MKVWPDRLGKAWKRNYYGYNSSAEADHRESYANAPNEIGHASG